AQCTFDWHAEDLLPGTSGQVLAATTWDPDGPGGQPELFVLAGSFTLFGNTSANRIVAWNGSEWQALGSGLSGTVNALTVYQGELIAAGSFTTAGGVSAIRI